MKELLLQHIAPARSEEPVRVRIAYRESERDRGQQEMVDFPFTLDSRSRDRVRWYLEEYLLSPYSVFAERAKAVRKDIPNIGEGLLRSVLSTEKACGLYGNVQNDLDNTRIVIDA